jgi:hypothetical protein
MMPNGNGMFLLVRTRARFPDMPFVMVTSTYGDLEVAAAYQEGAYDYLLKPFSSALLATTVHRASQYRLLKITFPRSKNRPPDILTGAAGPDSEWGLDRIYFTGSLRQTARAVRFHGVMPVSDVCRVDR